MSQNASRKKKDGELENSVEMDIHIQFPSKDSKAGDDEKLPEAIFTPTDGKEVLVILLGWAGAEHKYLSKYSDYYLQRGCIALRYITPLRYHFMDTRKLHALAHRVLRFVKDLQLDDHPIFFHVFSNGGSLTYSYIVRELVNQGCKSKPIDVRGTIFDSAPSPRRLQTTFNALVNILSFMKSFRYLAAGFVIFLLVCQVFWYHIKSATMFCLFGDTLDSLENPEMEGVPLTNWLRRIAGLRNHRFLFLYSNNDELIPADKIERFASIAEARGNYVDKVKFDASEHVMHFRRYPKEYSNAVNEFIRRSMLEPKMTTTMIEE